MLLMLLAAPVRAATVVELFTSQSCSSCPPADALLTELDRSRPDLLVLAYHVTYWDRLGWRDPYSLQASTDRQRSYAARWPDDGLYTPQIVVQGTHQAVGSDRAAVQAALGAPRPAPVALTLTTDAAGLRIDVGAGAGLGRGSLMLVGFDPTHTTPVGGGENGGRTLMETNVVRSVTRVGVWDGGPVHLAAARPAGERVAVLLQADDGAILASATPTSATPASATVTSATVARATVAR